MIRFLYENFALIAIAVMAASYVIIRVALRSRAAASTNVLPGIAPALITGLIGSTILVLVSLVLAPLFWVENSDRMFDLLWLPWLSTLVVVSLAVLDVYAIWPPTTGDRPAAIGRAFTGLSLALVGIVVIDGAIRSAASQQADVERREAEAAEQRAVEARSAALSIVVTVADARLGGPSPYGGRMVSHLSLDVEVRSTADILLIPADPDIGNNRINLSPETVSTIGVQPDEQLPLPTHLPAGFGATYRLEVPIDELTWSDAPISGREPADQFITGPWSARLSLQGAHDAGTPSILYTTTSSFTVAEAP